ATAPFTARADEELRHSRLPGSVPESITSPIRPTSGWARRRGATRAWLSDSGSTFVRVVAGPPCTPARARNHLPDVAHVATKLRRKLRGKRSFDDARQQAAIARAELRHQRRQIEQHVGIWRRQRPPREGLFRQQLRSTSPPLTVRESARDDV